MGQMKNLGTVLRAADNARERSVTAQACFGVQIHQASKVNLNRQNISSRTVHPQQLSLTSGGSGNDLDV